MFEHLKPLPADALLKLIEEHRSDPRTDKVDLGVGVYKNVRSETPVLDIVKRVERELLESQQSKAYLGTAGRALFNSRMQELVFGDTADDTRLLTVQAPGGSGALRLGAELIMQANSNAKAWVPDETWANHTPLLNSAGLTLAKYPYYDGKSHTLLIDQMLDGLRKIPSTDIVVLHACCHNPTGVDPSEDEWRAIVDVLAERKLVPMFDTAYLGFAQDITADAFAIRYAAEVLDELIVTASCSKNFGLYRERVGALSLLAKDSTARDVLASQASMAARTLYSMPPDHGAAVVARILSDDTLRQQWDKERDEMRDRLSDMRSLLSTALENKSTGHSFAHLTRSKGMFCYLGISAQQVARLKQDFGIYMADSSRINVAGITSENVGYLADSIVSVL